MRNLSTGANLGPSSAAGTAGGGVSCRIMLLIQGLVTITGADDQIADVGRQSAQLHQELPHSEFITLPGRGHMIHHLDADVVADAISRTAQRFSIVSHAGAV